MTTTELLAIHDRCKSFYGKAYVEEACGDKRLVSYNSHVATIYKDGTYKLFEFADYSVTTRRHVCEFLQQNGFRALSKSEMEQKIKHDRIISGIYRHFRGIAIGVNLTLATKKTITKEMNSYLQALRDNYLITSSEAEDAREWVKEQLKGNYIPL